MEELAQLVASDAFQKSQNDFFLKNCKQFDHEDENKLIYTEIYQSYETLIEGLLAEKLGIEKLTKIGNSIGEYIKEASTNSNKTKEVYEALEVLNILSDFQEFKKTMLTEKEGMAGGKGEMKMINAGVLGVAEHMDRIEALMKDANTDGFEQILDLEGLAAWTTKSEDGSTIMRIQIEMPLKPHECFEMVTTASKERSDWQPEMKKIEVLEEFAPGD